jgi:quercetin dioxygenase-like cupin family protein/predicted TIM-barrel fold metal-dependent hydrolase/quinol monooxygenase YgiN
MTMVTLQAQTLTDYHSHLITPEYRAALAEHGMLLDEGFPLPQWLAESHLALMDEAGIAQSILTHPAPHPFFGDQEECNRLCRQFNEQAATVCSENKGRFSFCAVLPLPDVQAAIREAQYAMDTLGAVGVKLATNVYGQYLGDEALDPLMEYLSGRQALVILHPHKPSPVNNDLMQQTPLAMQGYLSETTNAVCNMISRNVLSRYPGMRVVVPHCGAYLPIAIPRMKALYPVMRQNGLVGDIDFDRNIASLWFDLAGSPTEGTVDALLTLTSRDHLLYGSDYPYVAPVAVKSILADLRKRGIVVGGDASERHNNEDMIFRIAEIEVQPQYLKEYLAAASEIQKFSLTEEPGVICLFPSQMKEDSCQIRILEIYASQDAYQHHIQTAHFQKYKQGTLHMVKSLKLNDLQPLTPETMNTLFKRFDMKQPAFESLNSLWPKGEPNTGYAQYFIGNSYLAPMDGGLVNVTFEPRCRNNWHIHHKQVQVLICVAGRGWYQEWGKEPVELQPGMVIEIPEDVKHWHGAARDSWFQHLTYHKDVREGASNEWLEPVTDDIYNKLK